MLTPAQIQKHWRHWAAICATQGWAHEPGATKDARRKASYLACGLRDGNGAAKSLTAFCNADFSRWLASTAHLAEQIDIRDRTRENVVWTIERLQAALKLVLGADYASAIMRDFRETTDLDRWPVQDPLRFMRDANGKVHDSCGGRDLENLRNTLYNRLGRIITRIRDGQIEPGPECPEFFDQPQSVIIQCLIDGVEIRPKSHPVIIMGGNKPGDEIPPVPAPAKPKRQYFLKVGGAKPAIPTRSAPARTAPAAARPATIPMSYCMHPVSAPTKRPAPAQSAPAPAIPESADLDDNEPF